MTDDQVLSMLRDQAHDLDKEIRGNEHEIERWLLAFANGAEPGRAIEGLQDYHSRQNGLNFELGKVEARIEDLENRMREQADRDRETTLGQDFAEGQPIAQEDYLDWLRPTLDAPADAPERDDPHPQHEGEERMLEEMHRQDREPEDHLDWWTRS